MSIITISREFGSDGRELGKLPDDIFHFAYYDKEIILAIAEESNLAETYVEEMILLSGIPPPEHNEYACSAENN